MCHHAETTLPALPSSPALARRWVSEVLDEWGLDPSDVDLRLATSELVTNAVLHARTELDVVLRIAGQVIELTVRDHNTQLSPPRIASRGADSTGGRGLLLVHAICDEWGVLQHADGKDVWLRVGAPASWKSSIACRCSGRVSPPPPVTARAESSDRLPS